MTDKQQLFCKEYIIDLNATKAAIRAGFSERTARTTAYELMNKEDISEEIQRLFDERADKCGITAARVLEEYAKIAFFDIREIFDVDGGLVNIKQLDNNSAGAIASIKSSEEWGEDEDGNKIITGTLKEVKVFDKIRALQDLGKHLGLFEKDNSQKVEPAKQVIVINGKEVEF